VYEAIGLWVYSHNYRYVGSCREVYLHGDKQLRGQEGRQGWQAEGPTDFRTLDQLNLIQKRKRLILTFTADPERTTYEQVTIRLKRLVP
nr:hypothetical protein [Ktedonobacteraceae bacterium]